MDGIHHETARHFSGAPDHRPQNWRDIYYTSRDGLRLYGRHYPGSPLSRRRPAVCLAGLTRNSRDFHDLATYLTSLGENSRDVYTLDYRGRGLSESDPDWRNYSPYIETLDTLDFMAMLGLHDAAIIGTARGGMIAMIMGTLRPTSIGTAVLNDAGPVIETSGLTRLVGYVGRIPVPMNWDEATRIVRDMSRREFPYVDEVTWGEVARQWYLDENGEPCPGYDNAISKSMTLADLGEGIETMWPQFMALARIPVMVVRGANSDMLSRRTVEEMAARHPSLTTVTVPHQGHAPLLKDVETNEQIARHLIAADATYHVVGEPVAVGAEVRPLRAIRRR